MQHPYYNNDVQGAYDLITIGDLELEEGGVIKDCTLAVATHGTLNDAKDNVIVVPTWYSGTSKVMGDVYIGSEHALDPSRYFIIVINQIGNGLSTSPHHGLGASFPKVRIADDVRAQHRLLTQHFGISQIALVVGGSMGAQQTYEWCVRYPEMVLRGAPIAGTARNTEHDFMFAKTLMDAITSDPEFDNGNYSDSDRVAQGLRRHAEIWTVMGWSTDFFRANRHQDIGFKDIHHFVEEFMVPYFAPMDPNNLLCMAWKWQQGDVSRNTDGDLAAALSRITAKMSIMPISHDMFFPPADCEAEQQHIPGSLYRPLNSIDGHLALFGTDPNFIQQVNANLKELLEFEVQVEV